MIGKCIIFLTLLTFSSCDERNHFDRNSYSNSPDEISLENIASIYSSNIADVEVLQTFLFEERNFKLFSIPIPFANVSTFCIEQGMEMAKTTSGEETVRFMTFLNPLRQLVPIDISEWEKNMTNFYPIDFDRCGNSFPCFYEFFCDEEGIVRKCVIRKSATTRLTNYSMCEWKISVDTNTTEDSIDTTTIVPTTTNETTATSNTTTEPATTDSSNELTTQELTTQKSTTQESTTFLPVDNRLNRVEEKIDVLNVSMISLIKNLESLRENTTSNLNETSNRIELIVSRIKEVSNDFSSNITDTNNRVAKLGGVISGIDKRTNITVMEIKSGMKSFNKSIRSLDNFQMNIIKKILSIESTFDGRIKSIASVSDVLKENISNLSNQQEMMAKNVELLNEKVGQLSNKIKSFKLDLGRIKDELYQELNQTLFQDIVKELEKMFEKSVMNYKTMFEQMNQKFIKHSDRVNSRYNSFTIPVIVFTVLLIVVNLISIFYAQKFNNQIAMKENARRKKRISFEPVAAGYNAVNHPGHRKVGIKSSEIGKSKGNKRVSFKPLIEMVHSRDEQSDSTIQLIKVTSKRGNGKGGENEVNSSNDGCTTFQEVDLNETSREEDGTLVDSISRP